MEATTAWRCTCGNLNDGPFGAAGRGNEDGRYDICERCGFEIYDTDGPSHKLRVVEKYLMVPVSEPWRNYGRANASSST